MKYMISWFDRPQGSPAEYVQKRILEVFGQWNPPDNPKIELFVVRVHVGGLRLTVHKACSTFPELEFQVRQVVPIEDAVRVELEAIAWRDGLKGG